MSGHEMQYRAGTAGLGRLGIPDGPPGWSCICGGWRFTAHAMSMRQTGNNKIEAQRSFDAHIDVAKRML